MRKSDAALAKYLPGELWWARTERSYMAMSNVRIAAMLIQGGIVCSVHPIARREQPCTPDVAALPCHYRADFSHAGHSISIEMSTEDVGRAPMPQLFLVQACVDSMVVQASADFADWRSTMGCGPLPSDLAMYVGAQRQSAAMAELFSAAQLSLLEEIALEQFEIENDTYDTSA